MEVPKIVSQFEFKQQLFEQIVNITFELGVEEHVDVSSIFSRDRVQQRMFEQSAVNPASFSTAAIFKPVTSARSTGEVEKNPPALQAVHETSSCWSRRALEPVCVVEIVSC